ncbi:hypothetical protein [Anabaena azotica]|uniref:Uncharacterized protein n=1 Tax=Anabaena azotica FACHB-119 TaxID=947527 RepID=A0ABR8DC96_9NOST|nr:hypothetical protein [Anabaena azotica]MBD2504855.1 hypothetical protein [Anabaena azotica FACHB-119]
MDSQKQQQLLDEVQNELSNNRDKSNPNFNDSKNAVLKKKGVIAMTVTSNNTSQRTCGYDEDGNWVCKS